MSSIVRHDRPLRSAAAAGCLGGLALVAGCGGDDGSSDQPTPLSEATVFVSAEGLECDQDLFEVTQHEPGFVDPGSGFETMVEAAHHYWEVGDGTFRNDREQLTERIDDARVSYENEAGHTQLILDFVQIDGLWLVSESYACA